ncbi:hypothetical protein A3I48_04355 [Candidatus Daviesbacteria bacterium RIFCSPLOWO2_02_FULL_36_7]|uniref:Uncharacterized protein n=1 Tax=Candidatus Daviesbacteria bacterium RIFCSPLOWO2_02_FULL_36_7 TaxID=1797792 RepID=A0A1F5MHY6_9BACT|nr:MAG: hypothetical protein A3I48_04355 [Candidatus Daviesbacteria bacterium RIFCSPLOWO2_02_FULL_36_7]
MKLHRQESAASCHPSNSNSNSISINYSFYFAFLGKKVLFQVLPQEPDQLVFLIVIPSSELYFNIHNLPEEDYLNWT